ncbi:MAG TPA: T9SS type A sorting domain-containing protein [Candidatus Kapabacteria bacterium]|nr:T9SS type A sorting domain-containing protein [Candidatus Kapabacteria bacterium]
MKRTLFSVAIAVGIFCFVHAAFAQKPIWHQTGGPIGGSLRQIAVDSTGRVWAATVRGGVYYSSDHGDSWHSVLKGLAGSKIGIYSIAAGTDGFIYAIRIDYSYFFRLDSRKPESQWHWEQISPDTSGIYNYIVTTPDSYVFTNVGGQGIRRSTNDGTTWTDFIMPLLDSNVTTFAAGKPGEFCALVSKPTARHTHYVWRTIDNGVTWKQLPTPVADYVIQDMVIASNGNILVSTHAKTAAEGSDNSLYGGRIYLSADTGKTWTKVYERPLSSPDGKNHIDNMVFNRLTGAIYADAHGPTIRSTDNGATFAIGDTDKRGDEVFYLACDMADNNLYQACEPDGLFRSTDHGKTFVTADKGIFVEYLNGMAIDSKHILFTISENGLARSTDDGTTWSDHQEFGFSYFPSVFVAKNDHIFAASEFGIYRSVDDGVSIHAVTATGDSVQYQEVRQTTHRLISSKIFNGNSRQMIYSTDDGTSWNPVTPLPSGDVPARFTCSNDSVVVNGIGQNFYLSTDEGNTWSTRTQSAPLSGLYKMLWHTDGSVLALIAGNTGTSGVWRSSDAGASWAHIFPPNDATFQTPTDYFALNDDDCGKIFVGTDSGVYHSTDAQYAKWELFAAGLTWENFDSSKYINVSDIVQNTTSRHFFAASRGLSVFESVPYSCQFGDVPENISASTNSSVVNYPNPFANSTTIMFRLDQPAAVDLGIYDVSGKRIEQFSTGVLAAGEHTLDFNAANIPNGNYMIVLRHDGRTETGWMTVAK